jgi:hypothetical protein
VTRFRRTPTLAAVAAGVLLSVLAPPPGRTDEGLFLTWNDCALAGIATHDRGSACASNLGEQSLYCAFRMPFAVDSVLGVELVVDVQHSAATMPDWWQFAPGGCREGSLRVSFDFTSFAWCDDFLFGNAAGGLQDYTVGQPRGGANQARIRLAAALLPSLGYATLDATSLYYAAKLTLTNRGTVTPGTACAGCADPACLVLNSIIVRRQPGVVGGDVFLSVPGPGDANFATWQGGAGASCATVPARAVTWGHIKGLYR